MKANPDLVAPSLEEVAVLSRSGWRYVGVARVDVIGCAPGTMVWEHDSCGCYEALERGFFLGSVVLAGFFDAVIPRHRCHHAGVRS